MLPNFFYIKKHASYSYVDMYIVLGISTFHFNPFLIADDNIERLRGAYKNT